jgi:hypothetical protein
MYQPKRNDADEKVFQNPILIRAEPAISRITEHHGSAFAQKVVSRTKPQSNYSWSTDLPFEATGVYLT